MFEHIAHFAQQQSAAPPHSKMRFHSSVAPSPSTSQNSKVSHSSDQHMKASSSELEPTAVIIKEVDQRSDKVHEVDEEVLERRMVRTNHTCQPFNALNGECFPDRQP